jgi:hypothetical protein
MNDTQAIIKFETLPNEILIECFGYLNAIDIFYSFDLLNYRFYQLIRSIPLHLNCQHVDKSTFDQFCNKMLTNSQLKFQIFSLRLSNQCGYDQISAFLSNFSLNKFSHLRSLSLIKLDENHISELVRMLPQLSNLRHFNLTPSWYDSDHILTSLPTSMVQTLMIPNLGFTLELIDHFTSLANLTISSCSIYELYRLLEFIPQLRYISIETIRYDSRMIIDEPHLSNDRGVHLKRLIIHSFTSGSTSLGRFLQQTPNLEFLMISTFYRGKIIAADRWQQLITNSLLRLRVFKFNFSIKFEGKDSEILDKFQEFQSDFWHQQHQWHTECVVNKNRAFIYTVPYISNEFEVASGSKRYYNASINNANVFHKVINLTLFVEAITDTCEYHFSNVKSLRLENTNVDKNHAYPLLQTKYIQYLKMVVSLCNVTHLDISSLYDLEPSVLLQLLKEARNISSLIVHKDTLFPSFDNSELRRYLNKMIRKLDVTGDDDKSFIDPNEIRKLCQVFSNMEQFRCNVFQPDNLVLILHKLSNLSHMKFFSYKKPYRACAGDWLENYGLETDLYSFTIECENDDNDEFDDERYGGYYYDYYDGYYDDVIQMADPVFL